MNVIRHGTNTGYASRTAEVVSLRVCVCACVVRGSRVSSLLRKEVHRRFSSDKLRPLFSGVQNFPNSSSVKSPQAVEQN